MRVTMSFTEFLLPPPELLEIIPNKKIEHLPLARFHVLTPTMTTLNDLHESYLSLIEGRLSPGELRAFRLAFKDAWKSIPGGNHLKQVIAACPPAESLFSACMGGPVSAACFLVGITEQEDACETSREVTAKLRDMDECMHHSGEGNPALTKWRDAFDLPWREWRVHLIEDITNIRRALSFSGATTESMRALLNARRPKEEGSSHMDILAYAFQHGMSFHDIPPRRRRRR